MNHEILKINFHELALRHEPSTVHATTQKAIDAIHPVFSQHLQIDSAILKTRQISRERRN
ncbi:hypothetical protein BAY61_22560 [Prauserella marina]|nr:hypothetical protein BAY61_22560 [Prauserella marina]